MKPRGSLSHLLTNAFTDLKRNKIRTFLTSLGIMIGVFSVVILIALGLGLKNYIQNQFESLGSNLIMVFPGNVFKQEGGFAGGFGPGFSGGADFKEKDINDLKKVPEFNYVVPVFFKSSLIEVSGDSRYGYLMGVSEDYFPVMNLKTVAGHFFGAGEVNRRANVAVLGYTLAEQLFDQPIKALNQTATVAKERFKIVGVAEKKGDNEQDTAIIVPYKTTYGSLNPNKTFFTIYLGVNDDKKVEAAKAKAKQTLLKNWEEDDFSVTEQTEILSTVNQIFDIINAVLVAIGSISLIVGGIGIMNIMYASVTERTKEVGIRRAIGATEQDILNQFLTESVVLSLLGGFLGLLLATIVVLITRQFFPVSLNLLAIIVSLSVSSIIGVFFGVFPARRAAKLSPIEAIRYE
ncbi:ABC transporter permease [Patescibacteria group bacterium]|nr:ABC transporter permease [Patescibacteria group bacterium]